MRYTVVRVADEVVVNLMATACGIDYTEAEKDRELVSPIMVAGSMRRTASDPYW